VHFCHITVIDHHNAILGAGSEESIDKAKSCHGKQPFCILEWLIPPACLILCRQYGIRESKEVTIEGHVQFDLLQVGF
jgi:hypothetical protein